MKEEAHKLRKVITENLRVQVSGVKRVPYIDTNNAVPDACSQQNHVIFGRRGCGKTLLLHEAATKTPGDILTIYLNCEDFKNHSFPNVLIEILDGVFLRLQEKVRTFLPWKNLKSKKLIKEIREQLEYLKSSPDVQEEKIKESNVVETTEKVGANVGPSGGIVTLASDDTVKSGVEAEYQRKFDKIEELNRQLPSIKKKLALFFNAAPQLHGALLQLDDFYHLARIVQPLVMDYVHRLCKDLPLHFKVATIRHASWLFVERDGQPTGAQERHDYQPIQIDFTFEDFLRTERQLKKIFYEFGKLASLAPAQVDSLFKGDGFRRLVLAGGGVPRDCLSLFLEALDKVGDSEDPRIGKDEIRTLSLANIERRIQDLKNDSQADEQETLLKGIYLIRKFCIEKKNNIFLVPERFFQEHPEISRLIYRLLDYRIIHTVGSAFTHKSQPGSYRAFMIDIGCYAHLRKLADKMIEIDLADGSAKEKIRSAPIITEVDIQGTGQQLPAQLEEAIVSAEDGD